MARGTATVAETRPPTTSCRAPASQPRITSSRALEVTQRPRARHTRGHAALRAECDRQWRAGQGYDGRRMKPAPFEYVVVESVPAAVAALARHDGNARPLAGGQSLVALLNMRLLRPAAVVDLNRVPGLDEIRVDHGHVRI